ncbi:MAG: isoprenylcysteine carboxylmethyltransferase family protein [Paludibacteraceae bacterium]|nr:isoprenylcysteine carboxylmethyltransferase family protein [Paludibacteraceae bacterium]
MNKFRETAGYALGFILFVVLLPVIMWLCSGRPALAGESRLAPVVIAAVLMLAGLLLSIWAIVYMRRVGDGNPMDAFGHEVAPRTRHLMTGGPYRLSRNPMLTGTLTYLAGFIVWFWTWQAVLVWVIFFAIMFIQVLTEEHRLRKDFGDEYEAYCRRTGRFLPFSLRMW